MELHYYKVDPTGNITLLITSPVPREVRREVAALLMKREEDAEQVGFLEAPGNSGCVLRLQMAGGEFCGNASISAAALYAARTGVYGSLLIEVSGVDRPVSIFVSKQGEDFYEGRVSMPLPECVTEVVLGGKRLPLVRFPGICHLVNDGTFTEEFAEQSIASWCRELNAGALGVLFTDGMTMKPLVYVCKTRTAFWEHSCASGTAALGAYCALSRGKSGTYSFRQPCGTLSVDAVIENGNIGSLTLCGGARITGCGTLNTADFGGIQ